MIYGKPNNPYQINAANRSRQIPMNAPMNRLVNPNIASRPMMRKYQGGGEVAARRLMSTDFEQGAQDVWAKMTAAGERTEAQKITYERAQAELRRIQKAAKKNPWWKALSTVLSVFVHPALGAAVDAASTYGAMDKAQEYAEDAMEAFKGHATEDVFEQTEDQLGKAKASAPIEQFITSLALSEIAGSFNFAEAAGAEAALTEGVAQDAAGNVIDAAGKVISGPDFISAATTSVEQTLGQQALEFGKDAIGFRINPQLAMLAKYGEKLIPGLGTVMSNPLAAGLITTGVHEMGQPDEPYVDLTTNRPWLQGAPSHAGIARQGQV